MYIRIYIFTRVNPRYAIYPSCSVPITGGARTKPEELTRRRQCQKQSHPKTRKRASELLGFHHRLPPRTLV